MSQATYLRTDLIPLAQLTPYPGNAKRGDVGAILSSLCHNGQYRGLVVRETEPGAFVVLAGNHTTQALAAHGPGDCGMTVTTGGQERPCGVCANQPWEPVARCEIVQCDDTTAARINLVDNRSADLGSYDDAALAELIGGLDDLAGTGYSEEDLSGLLAAIEEATAEEEAAAAEQQAQDAENEERTAPAAGTAAPASTTDPTAPAGAEPPTPPPPGHVLMTLTYVPEDRDEAARLVSAVREVVPGEPAPAVVLRALRALVAVLDSRHDPDGVITVAALLKSAGIKP
jgi:hypothetical protein